MPVDNVLRVRGFIRVAVRELYNLEAVQNTITKEHTGSTPDRVAATMLEMFSGCWEQPRDVLNTTFNAESQGMIYVNDISFISTCAHHNLSFVGKAHFAYLPDKKIVGLSKIPRLVEVYSKRPQVQEKLTCEIVDTFNEVLQPKGCGLVMEAWHLCMMIRGVEQKPAYTKTVELRGAFQDGNTKQEFLDGIKQASRQIWP